MRHVTKYTPRGVASCEVCDVELDYEYGSIQWCCADFDLCATHAGEQAASDVVSGCLPEVKAPDTPQTRRQMRRFARLALDGEVARLSAPKASDVMRKILKHCETMSVRKIAQKIGVSESSLRRFKRGSSLRLDAFDKLADFFGMGLAVRWDNVP